MAGSPKGYPAQKSLDRTQSQFSTVEPIGDDQYGLTTVANTFSYIVASDLTEALSDLNTIVATGHVVLRGDIIRFNNLAANPDVEMRVEKALDANSFKLVSDLSIAPTVGDSFSILRNRQATVSASGGISTSPGSVQYDRNGVPETVELEVGGNPAINRPLPVKLMDLDGEITINTQNEIEVNSNYQPLTTNIDFRHSYDATTVGTTSGADEELIVADTGAEKINYIDIFDSSGQIMEIKIGAGAGAHLMYVMPGGGPVPVQIPVNSRLNLLAIDADATTGDFVINFYK